MQVVDKSAKGNTPFVVTGEYTLYDWSGFLSTYFQTVPQLLSYHQFEIRLENILARPFVAEDPTALSIVKRPLGVNQLAPVIPSKGLDAARQWYLYDSIREFCRDGTEDLVAPLPSVEKPGDISYIQYFF